MSSYFNNSQIFRPLSDIEQIASLCGSMIGVMLLALILRWYYIKYGTSTSNRNRLADTFVLLAVSVTLIISMIKSSIALSLGLVGALSIVRFRAAIKEPEEIVYLLFCIALGLGFGAQQLIGTTAAFFTILVSLHVINRLFRKPVDIASMILSVRGTSDSPDTFIQTVNDTLEQHSVMASVRRLDQRGQDFDLTYMVTIHRPELMQQISAELNRITPSIEVVFVDNSRPVLAF